MSRKRGPDSIYAGTNCSAPDCCLDAIINTNLGPCCNKHYLRVRAHNAFENPPRSLSRLVVCAECGKGFDRGYSMRKERAANNQYCTTSCRAKYARKRSAENAPTRFWSWVKRGKKKECWEW